ncbi:hypothetical protein AN644_01075 [Candidatus Epulonipiscium fishelsonii]|nr:hypothetical protein AN644_01075 [Epulopiscium sp. SCG-C06WGA-EpuloA1]
MEISYLIHTRTLKCDFNSQFMVRPEEWTESTINWARKNVLLATNSIDNLTEERWLIAKDKTYTIIGLVDFLGNIIEKCILIDKNIAEKFKQDQVGRRTYTFIGIVIKNVTSVNIENINYDYLMDLYIRYLDNIWDNIQNETIKVEFEKKEIVGSDFKEPLPNDKFEYNQNLILYEDKNNYKLINYYISNLKENTTICTNVGSVSKIKEFSDSSDIKYILSTNNNNIRRLQNELEKNQINRELPEDKPNTSVLPYENSPLEKGSKKVKKRLAILGVTLGGIASIITLILQMMANI